MAPGPMGSGGRAAGGDPGCAVAGREAARRPRYSGRRGGRVAERRCAGALRGAPRALKLVCCPHAYSRTGGTRHARRKGERWPLGPVDAAMLTELGTGSAQEVREGRGCFSVGPGGGDTRGTLRGEQGLGTAAVPGFQRLKGAAAK